MLNFGASVKQEVGKRGGKNPSVKKGVLRIAETRGRRKGSGAKRCVINEAAFLPIRGGITY